jgi:VIT1/CCC1 family predicted Fe2+/Mn2+ transporter
MVLTFTGSISVANDGRAEMHTVLVGAIGCTIAWGLVDATMYLMANFMARARALTILRNLRETHDREAAHRLILDAIPPLVSGTLRPSEVESLRHRLIALPDRAAAVRLTPTDYLGAVAIFLLVFLSTLPVVVPFAVMHDVAMAKRTSNVIAALLLFATGWSLGQYAGRPAWRTGMGTLSVGLALMSITVVLGG